MKYKIDISTSALKERIDNGYIKEWNVVVRTTHYPWGGEVILNIACNVWWLGEVPPCTNVEL
jgi:hypothetical protein